MDKSPVASRTQREQVYERLYGHILSPDCSIGQRLAPVRVLAEQFGTSPSTVLHALRDLERDGYVDRRHGSGVYVASQSRPVTMQDMVTLCIEAGSEVWSDLGWALMTRLTGLGKVPLIIDSATSGQKPKKELLRRILLSRTGLLAVHSYRYFPHEVFRNPIFQHKTVVGLAEWVESVELPHLYRVLTDYRAGAEMMAEHLWSRGHRRVLLIESGSMFQDMLTNRYLRGISAGPAFVEQWQARGGQWDHVESIIQVEDQRPKLTCDNGWLAMLDRPDAPTAVFGLMDCFTRAALDLVAQHRPHLVNKIEFVGYYDTRWSHTASPALTAVNLNVEEIADQAAALIAALTSGQEPPERTIRVRPRLIVREQGQAVRLPVTSRT